MNRYRMQFAPHVWKPNLNPTLVRWLKGLRIRHQQRSQRLTEVVVDGAEHIRDALAENCGVMLMPNHPNHADPFTIYMAGEAAGTPLYIMATWHVFHNHNPLMRWILSCHGCFSVDREANDIGAFKQAVSILESKPQPLVIFPEGEIYHCNDRVTPFREGAAAIATAAARKAKRKIVCVPCALRYHYLQDPTDQLMTLMGDLEKAIFWRRQEHLALETRIYRFAEALLAVKELEYFGRTENGSLPDRIRNLGSFILCQVEQTHELKSQVTLLPERVKAARRAILEALREAEDKQDSARIQTLNDHLDDLFLVVQSFSYPGDYVVSAPTIERMAETLDKFEEDVLGRQTATIKAERKATVSVGAPIEVSAERGKRGYTAELTKQVEDAVQRMLDLNNLPAQQKADLNVTATAS